MIQETRRRWFLVIRLEGGLGETVEGVETQVAAKAVIPEFSRIQFLVAVF
jgi:hypothetical protein